MRTNKVEQFYESGGANFKFLKSFLLTKICSPSGGFVSSVELFLTQLAADDSPGIRARFLGVSSLNIGDLNGMLASVINVSDISHRGLEDANFKVEDVEADCFSFHCIDFEFTEKL